MIPDPPPQPAPAARPSRAVTTVVRHRTSNRRRVVTIGGAAVVAILVVLAIVWSDRDSPSRTPESVGATTAPVRAATPTDPASAERALRAEIAADRTAVDALVDSWVPQLSSKRLGMVAGGITYGYPEIYANFRMLKVRYPDALLVWSGDFSSFAAGDFWVTVVPNAFPNGDEANAWCDRQGIDAGACYAKRISRTGGYQENTLPRR